MTAQTQEKTRTEQFKIDVDRLLAELKRLINEGNVRRISIKQGEHTIVELPLTVGLAGAVLAPWLAAVGAVAALVTDSSIVVERDEPLGSPRLPRHTWQGANSSEVIKWQPRSAFPLRPRGQLRYPVASLHSGVWPWSSGFSLASGPCLAASSSSSRRTAIYWGFTSACWLERHSAPSSCRGSCSSSLSASAPWWRLRLRPADERSALSPHSRSD